MTMNIYVICTWCKGPSPNGPSVWPQCDCEVGNNECEEIKMFFFFLFNLQHNIIRIYIMKVKVTFIEHTDLNTDFVPFLETDPVQILKQVNHTWYFNGVCCCFSCIQEKKKTAPSWSLFYYIHADYQPSVNEHLMLVQHSEKNSLKRHMRKSAGLICAGIWSLKKNNNNKFQWSCWYQEQLYYYITNH